MESNKALDSLALRIDCHGIKAMAWGSSDDDSLEVFSHDYPTEGDAKQRLEDVIYENRDFFLQRDFSRVWCLIADSKVLFVPGEADAAQCETFFRASFPDSDVAPESFRLTADDSVRLLAAFPAEEASFMRRTFYNVVIQPSVLSFARRSLNHGGAADGAKIYVNAMHDGIDVIALEGGKLLLGNSFACKTYDDAVYYVLAVMQMYGLTDNPKVAMTVSGTPEYRNPMLEALRRFVPQAVPAVLPSEIYRLGKGVADLPYELILTPLCEL